MYLPFKLFKHQRHGLRCNHEKSKGHMSCMIIYMGDRPKISPGSSHSRIWSLYIIRMLLLRQTFTGGFSPSFVFVFALAYSIVCINPYTSSNRELRIKLLIVLSTAYECYPRTMYRGIAYFVPLCRKPNQIYLS